MTLFRLFAATALLSTATAAFAQNPVMTPDQSVMRLDDLGLYQPGYALRGKPDVRLPVGSIFDLDSPTGAACEPASQNGREAWLMQCPWRGQTGVTFQEYTFRLPKSNSVTLTGYTALRSDVVGKSDGVTYRIFVDGQKQFEVNRVDAVWQPFTVDLTADAGKTATIRFETDPGPRNDPSFDLSLWGDRLLTIDGLHASEPQHPAPPMVDLARLRPVEAAGAAPIDGFAGVDAVAQKNGSIYLASTGPDGVLTYRWVPRPTADAPFGTFILLADRIHDKRATVPFASDTRIEWTSAATLVSSKATVDHGQAVMTSTYNVGGVTATLTVKANVAGKSLVIDVDCDKPLISSLTAGPWGPVMQRRTINLPYCSYPSTYLPREGVFTGALLDWTSSNASDHNGLRADYGAKTDAPPRSGIMSAHSAPLQAQTRNRLHERLIYTGAWTLDETLPNIPNPPSPYRSQLGRGVMLDIWGGKFANLGKQLHAVASAGLGPATAIIHDWQRSGYDNALPAHVPANAGYGGDAAMKAMVDQAKSDGIAVALHENYVDYYPDYEGFDARDIALASDGSKQHAWFNPTTKIQSFAIKPTRILALAATQSPKVERRYGTKACYLDVHSAVPPWFHVDFDASQTGSGKFSTVRAAHTALWAYERKLHGGPVVGEGNNHWYWSGLLDGVEAQFGQGWPYNQGLTAPLLVDFDLLRIHPLQLNHGMGYYERWWDTMPKEGLVHALDIYRMQEIAYGHEGFLGGSAWSNVPLALQEARLMTPVTSRTATSTVGAIEYENGGRWQDASSTAIDGGEWSRVRERFTDGVTVWANSSPSTITADGRTIPQYGWLAEGDGVTAGTFDVGDRLVDCAETPASVYVNARPRAWRAASSGVIAIAPVVASFQPTGPRSFRVTYRWHVGAGFTEDYRCFVHFTNASDEHMIRFQQDHPTSPPTSAWKAGQDIVDGPWDVSVPASVEPGDYTWSIGLYNDGGRLSLQGVQDSERRIVLGTVHLGGSSSTISFTPTTPSATSDLPDAVVEVGPVRTDGCVDIRSVGVDWVLRPIPASAHYVVALKSALFPPPASIVTDRGTVKPSIAGGWWRIPSNGSTSYRWRGTKGR